MSGVRKNLTGAQIETTWPRGRLRVVMQEHQLLWISRVARTDVFAYPLFGCWETPILTKTHDPDPGGHAPIWG